VAKHSSGNPQIVPNKNDLPPTAADLGFTGKEIHAARRMRDAEKAKPGIVEQTLAAAGEPTRARLKRAVDKVLEPPQRPIAQAEAARAVAPCDLHSQWISWCSFCGRDFGEDVRHVKRDECHPWDLHLNDYEDPDAAICFDCAKDAYTILVGSRRLATKAKNLKEMD
jgi:hypothetical protein